ACLTLAAMQRRGWWGTGGVVLLLGAIGAGVAAARQRAPVGPLVVVAREGVPLRKGDGESFPPWHDARLGRGVEGTLLRRPDDWLQVELAGGEAGWVHARDVVSE